MSFERIDKIMDINAGILVEFSPNKKNWIFFKGAYQSFIKNLSFDILIDNDLFHKKRDEGIRLYRNHLEHINSPYTPEDQDIIHSFFQFRLNNDGTHSTFNFNVDFEVFKTDTQTQKLENNDLILLYEGQIQRNVFWNEFKTNGLESALDIPNSPIIFRYTTPAKKKRHNIPGKDSQQAVVADLVAAQNDTVRKTPSNIRKFSSFSKYSTGSILVLLLIMMLAFLLKDQNISGFLPGATFRESTSVKNKEENPIQPQATSPEVITPARPSEQQRAYTILKEVDDGFNEIALRITQNDFIKAAELIKRYRKQIGENESALPETELSKRKIQLSRFESEMDKKETAEWENTKTVHTVNAYNDFVRKYPRSRYTDEARKQAEKIKPSLPETSSDLNRYRQLVAEAKNMINVGGCTTCANNPACKDYVVERLEKALELNPSGKEAKTLLNCLK